MMIECREKDNAVENSINIVVGAFINVSHNLQWVPNKLVFVVCRSFIPYRVSYFIGSVLLSIIEQKGGGRRDHRSFLKSNRIFLLLRFRLTSTFYHHRSLFCCCMCTLYNIKISQNVIL